MAEFLVHIEVGWPADGDETERDRLIAAERSRASELVAGGTIVRLWRVPGRWANYGIWAADSSEDLHAAIASLPFFPWLEVTVSALAEHPSDPGQRRQ
jgi:muconolactone D-isomerase